MKKLMYLLVAGSLSAFAACGGASTTEGAATDVAVEEVSEAVGCHVEGGACLADHSCCAPKAASEAHVDHDHSGDDHDHSGDDHDHSGDDHDHSGDDHDHAGDDQE